jgi:hypothetical protein
MFRKTLFALFPCLLFATTPIVAQTANCTFTFFQAPAPPYGRTLPGGINRYGNVVGTAQGHDGGQGMIRYSNGTFKFLLAPNSIATWFNRRNASGVTVGAWMDSNQKVHGAVYANGTWRTVDYPGALRTELTGINLYGTIVGFYLGSDNNYHGFKLKDGKFSAIQVPGSRWTSATSISDTGVIVGYWDTATANSRGFILKNGVYASYEDPKDNGNGTYFNDINASGTIVGGYFPNENPQGFIFKNGVFEDVVVPGSLETPTTAGINGYGTITGEVFLSSGSNGYIGKCQ